ncbi:MAG: hypothetical protein K8W52_18380 [Deltaproteobacteria bacterium]|nr:hypothetical protein [Deltaproteobacteria bacterium]
MTTPVRTWSQRAWAAATSPGNLLAGAGALALASMAWTPLPLVLFGLGEPVWLARAARDPEATSRQAIVQGLEAQLEALVTTTPCGEWIAQGLLPDYVAIYGRLVETRAQTARVVAGRDDATRALADDIVDRLDDMLRAYLTMARDRLLFHCSLARVYPQLPTTAPISLAARIRRALIAPAPAPQLRAGQIRFVTIDAAIHEVATKTASLEAELAASPDHAPVYRPILATLANRKAELARRGAHDRDMAAQLRVFPDQFELILSKLATAGASVSEVVDEMALLLEQTDDTVAFDADLRDLDLDRIAS